MEFTGKNVIHFEILRGGIFFPFSFQDYVSFCNVIVIQQTPIESHIYVQCDEVKPALQSRAMFQRVSRKFGSIVYLKWPSCAVIVSTGMFVTIEIYGPSHVRETEYWE